MGYTIRHAVPEDDPHLVRFLSSLQRFEMDLATDRAPPEEAGPAHIAYLQGAIEERGGCTLLAIPDGDNVPVAFCMSVIDQFVGAYIRDDRRTVAWIQDLWVDEDHRGGEVVDLLFAETEAYFREMGISRLIIAHVEGNDRARAAYLKRGFTPYEALLERIIV